MPIDEAALAAAVDKGIADAASAPTTTPAGGNDDAESTGAEGGELEATSAPAAQPGGEGAGEGDSAGLDTADGADSDESTDAPAGTAPATVGADGKPVAPAGAKLDEAAPAADPLDRALNDPIPNALKKETKERIQTLAGKVRELVPQIEERNRDLEAIMNPILESGATPVQYKQSLDYLRLVNSPSRADKEKALEIMQGEIRALASMIGKPVPGVNFLEGHDDLIQEVGTGRLTHERAMEIAAARAAQGYQKKTEERVNLDRENARTQNEAVAVGREALNQLEASLKADPSYFAKKAILIGQLKPTFARLHPSQWAAAFHQAYIALPAPARPVPPPPTPSQGAKPSNGGGNTPLRASNPAGAQQPAPSSLAEAIDFGIRNAR